MTRSLAALALLLVVAACNPLPGSENQAGRGRELAIASDFPLSGTANASLLGIRDAIALAIHEKGSVRGYNLIYEPFDDALVGQVDRFKAHQNIKLMIRDSRVVADIGPWSSLIAWNEIPQANEASLPMLSPSTTANCLTMEPLCYKRPTPVNNYFRTSATDTAQSQAAARYAVQKLALKRFAVLDDDSFYGANLAIAFSDALISLGGTVVLQRTYPPANDYSQLLSEARRAGAEAVFVGGTGDGGACAMRSQMEEVMPDAYMIGGDGLAGPSCVEEAGPGANDHLLATVADSPPPASSKVYQDFVAHHVRPVEYAFGAYDCTRIVIDAIDRAMQANGDRAPTRAEVLDAIAHTRDFHGATGTFTFGPTGDPTTPAVSIYTVQDHQWVFLTNAS